MKFCRDSLLIVAGALALAACSKHDAHHGKAQVEPWGFDLAGMDRSARPGDDFFRYANGNWVRSAKIPADKSLYDEFVVLEDRSAERTHQIL